jgi:hypothetical protein
VQGLGLSFGVQGLAICVSGSRFVVNYGFGFWVLDFGGKVLGRRHLFHVAPELDVDPHGGTRAGLLF